MKDGVLKKIKGILKKHRKELVRRYSVEEIGIFGSYIRGEQRKRSDVDILVEFKKIPDLLKFIEIESYLEKLFKKKVDLVRKKSIREELKDIILREVVYI